MNKQERKLKGIYKFKKRLKNYSLIFGEINNTHHVLRSTGKPCSCAMCSPGKVQDKAKYRFYNFTRDEF